MTSFPISKNNYLVGGLGTGTAFGIISTMRSIWGDRLVITGTDINPAHLVTGSLLVDKFIQVGRASDPDYSGHLGAILLSENIGVYIPILNEEIVIASKLSKMPEFRHIEFFSNEIYEACIDKKVAHDLMARSDVALPALRENQHPDRNKKWFVKPKNGVGSFGARIVSESELIQMDQVSIDSLLIQEVCEPPEITVDSFFDCLSGEGIAYARERIETKSGVCTKAAIFQDAEISQIAIKIGKTINQRGSICFQVMRSGNEWVLTDLNLRPGAGTAMSVAAGCNVIAAGIAVRRGEDFRKFTPNLQVGSKIFVTRQYSNFVMDRP
jgi:carbamoylphosphate synthase large subunit